MSTEPFAASAVESDRVVLARASGLPLSAFRDQHLAAQLRRALATEGAADAAELARRLTADPKARSRFRRSIAVSVSGHFRDPHQFELLERELLGPLLADGGRLRVWSAGCADGSELTSVGRVLMRHDALERAHLLGSDLLEENLGRAREGAALLPPELSTRLRWELRDLTADGPPPGSWHLVLCRNVAIYLTEPARAALDRTLAAALAPGGVLLLGRAERLSDPRALGLEQAGPHAYRRPA
jgi:chemotaxis protein methyltransferase CheR